MDYKFVLASGSPRRREIMNLIGAEFIVIPSDKDEDMSEKDPELLVKSLSLMKADDVSSKLISRLSAISSDKLPEEYKNSVIIGCDTVVVYDGKILGKPHSDEEAFKMIRGFSGKYHHVFTGVCMIIIDNGVVTQTINYAVSTKVNVSYMSDEEISRYIATGETRDKAGAYAIQGRFCPFIEGIEGDYYNIVGFPINSIYHTLKLQGINLCK